MRLLAMFGMLVLVGCASAPSAVVVCPRLFDYPPAVQRQVADAYDSLPPAVARMIEDYGRLRAEIRAACR